MIYYIIIIFAIVLFVFFIGFRIYNENESNSTSTKIVTKNEAIDFSKSSSSKTEKIIINPDAYSLPDEKEIKTLLNDLQFDVTQNCGTERAFENEYWNNYEKGIYVDIVTGEPLFFSSDKFKSGTGWPSFTKPVSSDVVTLQEDNSLFMSRIEVKSRIGNTHLGHVFEDGPDEEGGLRYCINSAAIRFIPYDEMEKNGYEYLMKYLD